MPDREHPRRPPDIPLLLSALSRYEVRYVLTGSVAAALHGADVGRPGDLHVTPALYHEDLRKLAGMLLEIEARPEPVFGHGQEQSDGELKWIEEVSTPDLHEANARWSPDPGDAETMSHLFLTGQGNVDIVAKIGGTYETLMLRAVPVSAYGDDIWIAHIDDLLAHITVPRRAKDIPRVRQLREIQRERGKNPLVLV